MLRSIMVSVFLPAFLGMNAYGQPVDSSKQKLITEEVAIEQARAEGFYITRGRWIAYAGYSAYPNQWHIISKKYFWFHHRPGRKSGKERVMIIDASTGEVSERRKGFSYNPRGKFKY